MMDMGPHLSDDVLEEYLLQRLPQPQLASVEEHLLVCEECRVQAEEAEAFILVTKAAARASFSSSSAMVGLNGSSLLIRDRVDGVCAGVSKYFLMVCQLMRRCCSILRMGQRSAQYR